MNTAVPRERKGKRTIVHSNPMLSRLSKVSERTETNAASPILVHERREFIRTSRSIQRYSSGLWQQLSEAEYMCFFEKKCPGWRRSKII